LGTQKYGILINDEEIIEHSRYYKHIENHTGLYLDSKNQNIFLGKVFIKKTLPYGIVDIQKFFKFNLDDMIIDKSTRNMGFKCFPFQYLIDEDTKLYDLKIKLQEDEIKRKKRIEDLKPKHKKALETIRERLDTISTFLNSNIIDSNFNFKFNSRPASYVAIDMVLNMDKYTFFIDEDCIQCKKEVNGWYKYRTIENLNYDLVSEIIITEFITKKMADFIRKLQEEELKAEKRLVRESKQRMKEELLLTKENRVCLSCEKDFTLELGEIQFFKKKDFSLPKRCKECRQLRKQKAKEENKLG
jgi:hypothetical protein